MAQARSTRKRPSRSKQATKTGASATKKRGGSVKEVQEKNIEDFRETLTRGVLAPLNLVMLTRDRIQEAVDDAVERGRITHADAQDLVQTLFKRGRKQTDDVLADLERLVGRGRDEIDNTGGSTRERATRAAVTARNRVEAATTKVRHASMRRESPPVSNYEKLTAAQVRKKLDRMDAKELRKIRSYEESNANRKSVLDAVERGIAKASSQS